MNDVTIPSVRMDREYCSTSDAAQMLGVSLGTVQQMVENGLLEAWKTAGGHRRIKVASVEDYLRRRTSGSSTHSTGQLRVLVAEDDLIMQRLRPLFDNFLKVCIEPGQFLFGFLDTGNVPH